jgi:hypothetical protein
MWFHSQVMWFWKSSYSHLMWFGNGDVFGSSRLCSGRRRVALTNRRIGLENHPRDDGSNNRGSCGRTYSPILPEFATKRWVPNTRPHLRLSARDEIVIVAPRVASYWPTVSLAGVVRQKEDVARQCGCHMKFQASNKAGADRGSGGRVVCANRHCQFLDGIECCWCPTASLPAS